MPASISPSGVPATPADPPVPVARLVDGQGDFAPVASPVLTLRRRITDRDDHLAVTGDTPTDKWPPLVRVALPIILSIFLWGGILALILRR